MSESGYRLYTDADFIKLQKIIVLKNLGFSLEDISAMTREDASSQSLKESFDLQLTLVHDKIEELKRIEQALKESSNILNGAQEPDWKKLIPFIHLINMQENLSEQYKNSKNIDVRIQLHQKYAMNKQGWYPWIYEHLNLKQGETILEVGCGNGQLWLDNTKAIPDGCKILLSDLSQGMLRQAELQLSKHCNDTNINSQQINFQFERFDCSKIPYPDESFDVIIANHLLFYLKDLDAGLREIKRVLKSGGRFYCTTYGRSHMKEIDQLVKDFDSRIALSEIKLFDLFGLDHGEQQLSSHFKEIKCYDYPDYLIVTDANDLLEYIYSCHGNQMSFLKGQMEEFEDYIRKKVGKRGIKITKNAGLFLCT